MEAGPLAELAVPGLERLGGGRVLDDVVDPRSDLVHLLEVGELHRAGQALGRHVGVLALGEPHQQLADDVGPAVHHQVAVGHAAGGQQW